ncbi:hypothetical protein D3C80_885050 [compost metagenome]
MAHGVGRITRLSRKAHPKHLGRDAEVLYFKSRRLADDGVAAIRAHHQISGDLDWAFRRIDHEATNTPVALDQAGYRRIHQQPEVLILPGLADDEIEKIPLRHEGDETMTDRQPGKIRDRDTFAADNRIQPRRARMRQAEELVDETQLLHQFKRGGVDGIAAKIAQEIPVFLDHRHIYTAAGKQQAKHHTRRPTACNGNGGADVLNRFTVIFRRDFHFFHHISPFPPRSTSYRGSATGRFAFFGCGQP